MEEKNQGAPAAGSPEWVKAHATWQNCNHESEVSGETCLACQAESLRAAASEARALRDEEWRKAVNTPHVRFHRAEHGEVCDWCAPLDMLVGRPEADAAKAPLKAVEIPAIPDSKG